MQEQLEKRQNTEQNSPKRGRFIVFEGLDGAGKSTQIKGLAKWIRGQGRKVYVTAEPTTAGTGGLIRDALSGNFLRSPSELAGLFLADRIAHNVNPVYGIQKFLREGTDVICDRYYYSSFAYQGMDTDLDWIIDANCRCPDIAKPDLCIFLDLDPENCTRRMSGRGVLEIYEGSEALLQRTRAQFFSVFRRLSKTEEVHVVDAARSPEEVTGEMIRIVRGEFGQ